MRALDAIDESPIFTGERVIEGATPRRIWQDHVARYQFASYYARGKVLDIACGTGYGCKILLDSVATRITGIDLSQEAICVALKRYKNDRIAFMVGDILDIRLPTGSQDVITCFETIEHVTAQEKAVNELRRVLNPNGTLLISSPNRKLTSPGKSASDAPDNPFHVNEFSTKGFVAFLSNHFATVTVFGQRGFNKLRFLPALLPFTNYIYDTAYEEKGSSSLERVSPFKEYRYITALCGRPRLR